MRVSLARSELYSPTYVIARQRFREAALDVHAQIDTYPIDAAGPSDEDLTIDVAWIGAREPTRALVVTSGLHGVEGFFGSAVQLSWLRGLAKGDTELLPRTTVVLVHAVNPFGFAWRRRPNEQNVDLNRNFLHTDGGEVYSGTPEHYERVHRLLNPSTLPSRFSRVAFRLRSAWLVTRYGMPALRTAVSTGQYEHRKGLFYGGDAPSQSTCLVQDHFLRWTRGADDVLHLDLHTGLGTFADFQLFVEPPHASFLNWYRNYFDRDRVVSVASGGTYAARGVMGAWLAHHANPYRYRFVCVEFGTYPETRVLAALRAENRVHHHAQVDSRVYAMAKRELVECFYPRNQLWREKAIARADKVVCQAMEAVSRMR